MTKKLILMGASLCFVPLVLSAASFEGTIKTKVTQKKKDVVYITYHMKEPFVRIESMIGEKKAPAGIIDMKKKTVTSLMPEMKSYMVADLKDPFFEKTIKKSKKNQEFIKTGEKKKILGYLCEKWISKEKKKETDVWVAKGFANYLNFSGKGKKASVWEKEIAKSGAWPLLVIERNKKGKETYRMETLSVKKKKLNASLFAPPNDYQPMALPNLGDLLKGFKPPTGQ